MNDHGHHHLHDDDDDDGDDDDGHEFREDGDDDDDDPTPFPWLQRTVGPGSERLAGRAMMPLSGVLSLRPSASSMEGGSSSRPILIDDDPVPV
jgi:hypothetical protein